MRAVAAASGRTSARRQSEPSDWASRPVPSDAVATTMATVGNAVAPSQPRTPTLGHLLHVLGEVHRHAEGIVEEGGNEHEAHHKPRRGPQMCISTFTLTRSSTFSISRSKRFRCRFLLLLLVIPGLFSGWTDEGLFSGWISSLGNISAALWGAKTCKSAISGKGIEFQQQRHAPPQMFLKALGRRRCSTRRGPRSSRSSILHLPRTNPTPVACYC